MKFDKMGWVVAAALAGGMVGMGFQTGAPKFGVVDVVKVFNESDYAKRIDGDLRNAQIARVNVLRFISEHRSMATADAEKYAELSTKAAPTAADKKELERITTDANAAVSKQRELITKSTPTPEDQKAMQDFSARNQQNNALQNRLGQEFQEDMREMQENLRNEGIVKVRATVKDLATKQGYTVVFDQGTAPFAANDLTAEVLKAVKK